MQNLVSGNHKQIFGWPYFREEGGCQEGYQTVLIFIHALYVFEGFPYFYLCKKKRFNNQYTLGIAMCKYPSTKMESYSLKWKDFQSNVSATFKKLRSKSEFFDVTLVSDDHKQVAAHKVVLSASSTFSITY